MLNNSPSPTGSVAEVPLHPDTPVEELKEVVNPDVNINIDTKSTDKYSLLFLTNYRSFQQKHSDKVKQQIAYKKMLLMGKHFKIRAVKPRFCGKYKSAKLKIADGKISELTISGVPCKSWTCPVCALKKALRVKYLLRDIILLNDLGYFLTLTLAPIKVPPEYKEDSHRYITKLFNHLLTILRRKTYRYYHKNLGRYFYFDLSKAKGKLKYVWVIEFQKGTHNAHMHILLNQFLPIVVVRRIWEDIGGGAQMFVEPVKSNVGISNYITDYIIKGIKDTTENVQNNYGFKYFQRRFSVSKSCIRPYKDNLELFKDKSFEEKEKELINQNLGWILKLLNSDGNIRYKFDSSVPPKA